MVQTSCYLRFLNGLFYFGKQKRPQVWNRAAFEDPGLLEQLLHSKSPQGTARAHYDMPHGQSAFAGNHAMLEYNFHGFECFRR
jgi:hypothetical protein